MFEWPNKYEVELAIDQQKIAQGKADEVQLSFDWTNYGYGSRNFQSREQAIYWIKNQDIHIGYLYKEIRHEQLRLKKDWKISSLEDLFQVFIQYYKESRKIQKQTLESLNQEQENIIGRLSKDATHITMKFPTFNYANLIEIWTTEFKPFLPNERILPIPNPSLEEHGYNMEELWDFVRQSILSLGWKEVPKEVAQDIARRIVIIEWPNSRWTGFIMNGRIVTNDHVLRWEENIQVFDLTWKEFDNLTYSLPKEFDGNWDKDIAHIDSSELKEYSWYPTIPDIEGGYIFGVKRTHRSILRNWKGSNPLSLWISKVELSDCNDDHGKNQWEFTYKDSSGGIAWTSGSIVYNNGKPVWVHWFRDLRYLKKEVNVGYWIFAYPESYVKETWRNSSWWEYFDLPKNKQ